MGTPTLPRAPDPEPLPGGKGFGDQRPEAVIRARILHALGERDRVYRVAVVPLWRGHYRVNVLTGVDAATARIAHSYFVVADDRGAIAHSVPEIARGSD